MSLQGPKHTAYFFGLCKFLVGLVADLDGTSDKALTLAVKIRPDLFIGRNFRDLVEREKLLLLSKPNTTLS